MKNFTIPKSVQILTIIFLFILAYTFIRVTNRRPIDDEIRIREADIQELIVRSKLPIECAKTGKKWYSTSVTCE